MQNSTQNTIPKYLYVMWFTLILAFGFGIFRGDWSTVFVSLATLFITLYAVWLSRKITFKIPTSLLTAAIIFAYATLFLGEVHDFYERFWWWDAVLHTGSAIGFGLIGAIVLILMSKHGKFAASPMIISIFVFMFAVAIGSLWEIFEFGMDQIFGLSMQKSGLVDTMYDLIVDNIGALIAAGATYAYLTNGKQSALTTLLEEAVENN